MPKNIRDLMIIDNLATRAYKKCSLCGRVRSIFYRLTIKDAKTASMVVGSLQLCNDCGGHIGDVIGIDPNPKVPGRVKAVNL